MKPAALANHVLEIAESISEDELRASTEALASDEFEGRGPGSTGDELARAYLASQLEALGLTPAFEGDSWQQLLEIIGITSQMQDEWTFKNSDGAEVAFEFENDYMGAIGGQEAHAEVSEAEVVFVGYGIDAPEQQWNDYKGMSVEGKVLLMLNDDPDWDPSLFEGERKLYAGRWTYKYEIAARKGAVGAIIIHTTPSAGYPWPVVVTGWTGEQFELPAGDEPKLAIRAWLTEDSSQDLVALAGHSLEDLVASAHSRDFEPVSLGISTSIEITATTRSTQSANVGGILQGSDAELKNEFLVYSAHHDHFGIGSPDETGDIIYNGALDNSVAMAQSLSVARAFTALDPAPRRSVLFLFVAVEEQGSLGSKHFVESRVLAPSAIATNINFELGNVWGPTHDVVVYGSGKSELDDLLASVAAIQHRHLSPEPDLRAGWFYRSDQVSFARAGVPAIWFKSGTNHVGQPAEWGAEQQKNWIDRHYHRPSDEIHDHWQFDGLRQDAQLAFMLGLIVANSDETPNWTPGDEFEAIRLESLGMAP
ncbi:MAG: M28 family peptidase [bacterium]|nr:M28 family peptidase [bacterium]